MRQLFVLYIIVLPSVQWSVAPLDSSKRQAKRVSRLLPGVFPVEELPHAAPAAPPAKTSTPHYLKRTQGPYTGITGFCDYQTNTGAPQHIRFNPVDSTRSHIHVSLTECSDPASLCPSHGSRYAYSSDGGVPWNTRSALRQVATPSACPAPPFETNKI
jgi:hypothetical protein